MLDPAGHKAKTAHNRANSPEMLRDAGVHFESKNDGAHLLIYRDAKAVADFWPGTGLWILRRNARRGRGVRALIREVNRG